MKNQIPHYDLSLAPHVRWLRPHEFSPSPDYFSGPSSSFGDVSSSPTMLDHYLTGAAALLATSPLPLIEDVFGSGVDDFKKYGLYTCRFYKNGKWADVVCDTRLPCIAAEQRALLMPDFSTTQSRASAATSSSSDPRGGGGGGGGPASAPGGDAPSGGGMRPCYGSGSDISELYMPFLLKAYAKLHGCYEAVHKGSIAEALVDLTGGSCDKIALHSEKVRKLQEDGILWDDFVSFMRPNFVVGASADGVGGDVASAQQQQQHHHGAGDTSGEPLDGSKPRAGGLLPKRAYGVVACREVSSSAGELRLVKVRNPWSRESDGWQGDWSNGSTMWDDYPEVFTQLSEAGLIPAGAQMGGDARAAGPATFWMTFDDFCRHFSKAYVCRIFPDDQQWRQYCMHGEWVGKTAGGANAVNQAQSIGLGLPAKDQPLLRKSTKNSISTSSVLDTDAIAEADHDEELAAELKKLTTVVPEADAFWFNNPQYLIHVSHKCKVNVSLMQQDRRIRSQLRENYIIAFEVVRSKKSADSEHTHPRVWELVDQCADSTKSPYASHLPQREVTATSIDMDPMHIYRIIPHPVQRGREGKFFLRVFSNQDLQIEQIGETFSLYLPGSWDKISERETSGGPLRAWEEKAGGSSGHGAFRDNSKWCQNPQFILTTAKPLSQRDEGLTKSVNIKIVIRRTDSGKKAAKRGSRDENRKGSAVQLEKKVGIGVVVCKAPMNDKDAKAAAQRRKQADAKINALGQRLPTKESSLKSSRRKYVAEQPESLMLEDDQEEGGAPKPKVAVSSIQERKMVIDKNEWSVCSDYSNSDVCAMYLHKVDIETLSDGLLIIPSLSEKGMKGSFTLEVHSDFAVKVEELPESRSKTISGEWAEGCNGGSHLNPDWKKNPRYQLHINSAEASNVKITLSRNEKTWGKQCHKDSIGCMMGFYLMQGSKPTREGGFIYHEGKPWNESSFVPLNSVSTPEGFRLDPLPDDEYYSIMPATFDAGKKGPFFLSVVMDADFTLKLDKGDGTEKSKTSGRLLGGGEERVGKGGKMAGLSDKRLAPIES